MNGKIILKYLLLKISANEINIGDKLPTKGQLKYKFNCNIHTIEKVYIRLLEMNLIKYELGKGYFLINSFEKIIDFKALATYNYKKKALIDQDHIPLQLLSDITAESIMVKGLSSIFFMNHIPIGVQFVFIAQAYKSLLSKNVISILKFLTLKQITINNIKRKISFFNNDRGDFAIKDKNVVAVQILLLDENENQICSYYNIYALKVLQGKVEIVI